MTPDLRRRLRRYSIAAVIPVVAGAALASGAPAKAAIYAPPLSFGTGSAPWGVADLGGGKVAVSLSGANAVDVITTTGGQVPPAGTSVATYSLGCTGGPANCNKDPRGLILGPDGNLWFVEQAQNNTWANKVGYIDLHSCSSNCVHEFAIPTASAGPEGITVGADGNLWFTEETAGKIGMIPCSAGTCNGSGITDTGVGVSSGAQPFLISPGTAVHFPVWFTERDPGGAAQIAYADTTAATVVHEITIANRANGQPFGITLTGSKIWFTEQTGHRFGTIDPSCTPTCTGANINDNFLIPSSTAPSGIAADSNGNLWAAENNTGAVAELNPTTSSIVEYYTTGTNSSPLNLVFAHDASGNYEMWTTGSANGMVAVVNWSGTENASQSVRYMAQVYDDLLDRPMDSGGLAYWTPKVGGLPQRQQITGAFVHTQEYQAITLNTMYNRFLGHPSNQAGFNYWGALLNSGYTYQQIEAYITGSAEYFAVSQSACNPSSGNCGSPNAAYIQNLYFEMLHRNASPSDESFWQARLNAGAGCSQAGNNCTQVSYTIETSAEGWANYINDSYVALLRHGANQTAFNFWTPQLTNGSLREEWFIASLTASNEYFAFSYAH